MAFEIINPATGEQVESYEEWSTVKTRAAIEDAYQAWFGWRTTDMARRCELMHKVAAVLRGNKDKYARMMALEMGKPIPIGEGRAEIEKCALACEFFAEHGESFLAEETLLNEESRAYVGFRPLGMILAIMPWNFPFWQVFRCAIPALIAGNTVLLKHSSNVPRCAMAIDDVFVQAGLPANVFRTLMIGSAQIDAVIANSKVMAVSFTGSVEAGRKVAAKAGEMLKKVVLELGGSDPFIVLADADLDQAAAAAARSRCINSGQSCIAAKRIIVEGLVYDAFMERFQACMEALVVGDPLDEETQVGPLARKDLLISLHSQVEESISQGAKVILGGSPLDSPGYYYPPTILADVRPGMPASDQELFGPVAAVIRVRDVEEAFLTANATDYGLGASIWTSDIARGEEMAAWIEAGSVFINGMVQSDPRLPFGGIKGSGYGRELSCLGIREFVNIQTVWVKPQ